MSELGMIIKTQLRKIDKTQGWLAEEVGVSNNAVSKWIKTGKISRENAVAAADKLGISVDALLGTGADAAIALFPGARRVVIADDDSEEFVHIQKVKLRLSAGITSFQAEPDNSDGGTISVPKLWLDKNGYQRERLVALRVKGESMEPALYADDLVIVNTADTRPVDGVVFAVNYEGEAVIKRLSRDAGDWWLTSDNSDQRKYHRKICRGNDCILVGRVVRKESSRI